jgi:hypothetical protein
MPVSYTFKCPRCLVPLEYLFGAVYVGLGPEVVRCPYCRDVTTSHRLEWANMGQAQRVGFAARSAVGALIAAVCGSLGLWGLCVAFLPAPAEGLLKPVSHVVFGVAVLTLVALFQVHRVLCSLQRTADPHAPPYLYTFWSLETHLPLKFLVLAFAALVVGGIGHGTKL